MRTISTDVLVIGAGPTGLTLANLLGASGVPTMLVELRPGTSDMPRAIVVDDEGLRTFQRLGLAEAVIAKAVEGQGTRYETASGEVIAEVGRGSSEFGFAKRHFISQPRLEATLAGAVTKRPSVDVRFSTLLENFEANAEGILATLSDAEGVFQVQARYLVACDGGRSPIRERLGLAFEGDTYEQDWIVLDLANDPQQTPATRFICDPDRPTVIVPAPAGGRRYEFMLKPGETRDEATRLDNLQRLLRPYRALAADDIVRAAVYTFHARMAEAWRVGPILLAGDAAHLTPPFAGQGMNAGLRDATNLAWKLALVCQGKAQDGLLDTYEQERRGPCAAMIRLAVLMGQVVMPRTAGEAETQASLMSFMDAAPELRKYVFEMRFKPRPEFDAGAFVASDPAAPGDLAGKMISQPMVQTEGREVRLDEVLGGGFALLAQDGPGTEALERLTHPVWRALAPARVTSFGAGSSGVSAIAWDAAGAAQPLRAHRDQICLIRPDRYVAAAFPPDQIDAAAGKVATVLRLVDEPEV